MYLFFTIRSRIKLKIIKKNNISPTNVFKINQNCHQMTAVAVDDLDLASAFVVDFVAVVVVGPCIFVGV